MTTNLKLNTANWFKKQLLLLGLFILAILPLVGHAQQYPVRIIPVITPPYSLKLADYAHAPESKLQLQVLMTDLQQPQHHTGIKFFLQAGLNAQPIAQSNEFVIGQRPFLLTPGTNITLTSSQLKYLFDPQNLNGLNPQQYASPLPEGLYQFCFQAYDFYTKNNLSEKACASVFLNQYDPPQLNIPQNAEKIQAINPYGNGSGILFQWMPRQVAPNTKYNFILKEIWDTNQSPISAFLASPVLWKEETFAPNLYYSIDKTQLIPGRRYAWQVQAFSSNPFDNFNNFTNSQIQSANYKNNGLSEIFFFDYVENCQTPTFLMAKNKGRGRVEIHWNFLGNPAGLYKIQYRKKGANTPWIHTEAYQNSAFISGLEDLTEYEYRVGAVCGNVAISNSQFENNENAYAFSPVQFFTTDSQDVQNNNFQCGVMPAVDISNKEPLRQSLVANDTFTAGDFPVTIIEAQGSNGIFTGTGFIQVPYLADTKIKVAFNNISINSDKKLISGTVETEYDPNESAVHFASTGLGELFGDAGIKDITLDYNVSNVQFIATPPPGKIIIVGDNGKGNNSDTGSGTGSTQELPAGRDYTIVDKNGNVWSVDEDGNITSGGTLADGGKSTPQNTDGVDANGSANAITAKGIKVDFENASNSKYAFDKPKKLISDDYKEISGYIIPFKAVENKKTEPFIAKISITDDSVKADSLIFKTSKGVAIEAKKIDGTNDFELTLKGTYSYDKEEIQAVIKQNGKYQIAGVFNLVHISPKNIKLNLVPTTGVKIADETIAQIKNIYSKVAINLDITTKPEFDIKDFLVNNKLPTEDEFGDLSTYSQAQNNIISKYMADNKEVGLEYYIFVTDKPSSSGQGGYMKLNGQFGFVFNQSARTIAHELAHGALKLEHPFKQFKNLTKGETSSIMDYAEGTNFIFPEWKQINDPKLKIYAFQEQSEGENIANHFNYLMPNKVPFRFKNTDGKLATDVILVNPNNNGGNPNGTLYGFNLNGIEYTYKDGKFTSIDTTYVNQYSEKYKNDFFRLVIQDTSDKCKYYLVNRKITDFNKLNLNPNNRPYNLCNKEKLPLGGSGNANGTETREDILQKLNGIIANKLKEKFPEKEIKFSILDKKDTLYQQKLDEAIKQANYVIAIMDEDGKIKIKSSFQIPRWFANVLPDLGKLPDEDCSYEYINEGLTSLQNSDLYKISPRAEQIAMEMGVIAYRGLFGVLYCMTDEKKFVNSSFTQQFIGGAMHETIATFDVAQIVGGVISLVKSGAEKQIEAPINYYNNLKNISQKGSATPEEALQVILIPPMNTQIEGITKGIEIGNQFIKYYFTECDKTQLKDGTIANLCGYRYGQITIMVVPLVITAGEWAITKIGKIAELTKLSQTLATNIVKLDTQLATRGLMLAEEGGYTIIKNLENGSEITRIASKDAAEIEKVLQSLATDTKQIESFLAKYPQLKTIVDDLGDLKQFFIEDFGKANENILIELSKPNSKLFNSWKNYRHKFKTQIICK